jgi:GxxExxY protein
VKILYKDQDVGKYFLDFVVEDKIIAELKVRPKLGYAHIQQVMGYLKATDHKLAILIYFTRDGVKSRRVLNSTV